MRVCGGGGGGGAGAVGPNVLAMNIVLCCGSSISCPVGSRDRPCFVPLFTSAQLPPFSTNSICFGCASTSSLASSSRQVNSSHPHDMRTPIPIVVHGTRNDSARQHVVARTQHAQVRSSKEAAGNAACDECYEWRAEGHEARVGVGTGPREVKQITSRALSLVQIVCATWIIHCRHTH